MKESRKRKDYIAGNKSGAYITNLPISELRKNGIKISYVFTIEEYIEYMKGNNIIPSGKGLWDIMYTISKNYRDLDDFTRLGPPLEEKSMSKLKEDTIVYLKEGIKVIAENGDIYEVEDGDYVVINNQIRQGPILNTDILKSIDNDDKLEAILDLMEVRSEHYIINQLITGMNIELEHTDDIYIALNIAVDHVIEIPDYYTRLIDMERKAKNNMNESILNENEYEEWDAFRESINNILKSFIGKTEPEMIKASEFIYDVLEKQLDRPFVDVIFDYISRLELIRSHKDLSSKVGYTLSHNERKYGTEPRTALLSATDMLNKLAKKI